MIAGKTSAVAALVFVMVLWGTAYVISRAALNEFPPFLMALLRFAIASGVLIAWAQAWGGLALLPRPIPWGTLAAMGLTGVTLFFVTLNVGLLHTTVTETSLIQGVLPALTALLAAVWLGERLSRAGRLGIGLSLIGLVLVVLTGGEAATVPGGDRLLGDALAFLSAVSWAIYSVLGKRLQKVSGLAVVAWSSLIGTALLVPAGVYDLVFRPPAALSPGAWLAVIYLGLGCSAFAYLLWNGALRYLDAGQAGSFLNLIPVVGVVSAAVYLGETPTPGQLLGGLLVLLGVGLVLS